MKNIGNILIFNRFDKIQFSLRFEENQYSIPVSSTKKVGASRLFLCSGRFAVFIRPPPNLPSGGGLVASLRRGYGCVWTLFIRVVIRAAVAVGQ